MPSPNQQHRNGNSTSLAVQQHPRTPSPLGHHHRSSISSSPHFHSTVSAEKLRRLNALILLLRLATFCFSLAAAIFMSTDSSSGRHRSWLDSDPFRLVFAANAIVALYSLFEVCASVFELLKASTLLPEPMQLWFDFAHDQVFAYLLVSAEAAGTGEAVGMRRRPKGGGACAGDGGFCVQSDISIALGFIGFVFLALSTLISAFRVGCYLITGSRYHL